MTQILCDHCGQVTSGDVLVNLKGNTDRGESLAIRWRLNYSARKDALYQFELCQDCAIELTKFLTHAAQERGAQTVMVAR
jgi:hypothetical protein